VVYVVKKKRLRFYSSFTKKRHHLFFQNNPNTPTMRTKLIFMLMLLIGLGFNAEAADKHRREIRGDKYFFVYSFEKAISWYTHAKTLTTEGQRRLAQSYKNLNRYEEAEAAFATLTQRTDGVVAEDYYTYALVLRANGKYDQSAIWMDKLYAAKPSDLRAQDYMTNRDRLPELIKGNGVFTATSLNMNTDAKDFAPSYYKDKIVFTSSGTKPNIRKYKWTGLPFLNLYEADVTDGQLTGIKLFNRDMKGKMHDGPSAFSTDGNFIALTRNNYDLGRKDRVVNLHMFFSTLEGDKWSDQVPFALNNDDYSVGHPCFANNGNTMYFVSDMPGGFGGADIYRVEKNGSTWGTPVNLGDGINTEGDEMFPFFEEEKSILLFASNGRFGLGGLDIFQARKSDAGFDGASNVGAPINTPHDDFAIILKHSTKKGYFSSNRPGSGEDDIYALTYTELVKDKYIVGTAKDEDGRPIPSASIVLTDDKGVTLETVTTNATGTYRFKVEPDNTFKLTGKKVGYEDAEELTNTFTSEDTVRTDLTMELRPLPEPEEVPIAVGEDLGKRLKLKTIYFDFDRSDIRPDAVPDLEKVVKMMNDNPTLVIEVKSYTDCRGTKAYNSELSKRRAAATQKYLRSRVSGKDRVNAKGLGETNLTNDCACEGTVVSNCTEGEFQLDRRSEFIVVSK